MLLVKQIVFQVSLNEIIWTWNLSAKQIERDIRKKLKRCESEMTSNCKSLTTSFCYWVLSKWIHVYIVMCVYYSIINFNLRICRIIIIFVMYPVTNDICEARIRWFKLTPIVLFDCVGWRNNFEIAIWILKLPQHIE